MARITLRQLEYFVAVARAGSVTAGATESHISQSAVSAALGDLEETLGVQLFIRHRRGLVITKVGRQILLEARQLLSGADELCSHASDLSGSFSGSLTIGCYSTLSLTMLPRIVDTFLTEHPNVDLDFVVGSNSDLYSHLYDGSCEVALLYDYEFVTNLPASSLTKAVLQSIPPHALFQEGHPLARRTTVELAELVDEPMILYDLPPAGKYFKSLFEMRGLIPFIRFRTTEFELVRTLVARGFGYGILSQRTDIDVTYENRRFVSIPIEDASRGLNVVVAYVSSARLTRRASAFVDHCKQCFSDTSVVTRAGKN